MIRRVLALSLDDVALHILAAAKAAADWFFAHTFPEVEIGDWCENCSTVHVVGKEKCSWEMIRWCLDCNAWRNVNKWFHCELGRGHSVHPTMRYGFPWVERKESQLLRIVR